MSSIEPPWYFWLAALPLYGAPLYIIVWAIHRVRVMKQPANGIKGLVVGLGAWLGLTILVFVASFIFEPCLENCSAFRTPEGNARVLALILIYILLASVILRRLHKYGKT